MPGQTAGWRSASPMLRLRATVASAVCIPVPDKPASSVPDAASCCAGPAIPLTGAGARLPGAARRGLCRGPLRPGFSRCYQCERQDLLGRGLLADAVVPISYAIKGTAFAADLWRYKSRRAPAASARASVLALLLAFLADHGRLRVAARGHAAAGLPGRGPDRLRAPGPAPTAAAGLALPAAAALRRWPSGRAARAVTWTWSGSRSAGCRPAPACCWSTTPGCRAPAPSPPPPRSSWPGPVTSRSSSWGATSTRLTPPGPLLAGLAPARYDSSSCAVHRPRLPPAPHPITQ